MPDFETVRRTRLQDEFARIMRIRRPGGLIDFRCGLLSDEAASTHLGSRHMTYQQFWQFINDGLAGFMSPEQFVERYPDQAPEQYLVRFTCIGLRKNAAGEVVRTDPLSDYHLMEVVYVDFPIRPPRFVWLTDSWHPNIFKPFICNADLPFPVGATLDQVCLMAGRMTQYRHFNLGDPLLLAQQNGVIDWVKRKQQEDPTFFPLDTRDLVTGVEYAKPLVQRVSGELIEWVSDSAADGGTPSGEALIEWV